MIYHRLPVTTWLSLVIVVLAACSGGLPQPNQGSVNVQEAALTPDSQTLAPVEAPPQDQGMVAGIAVGFTPEGYPYRGDPDAPVTVQEFSDFLCPFCGRHVSQTEPGLLAQYVQTGQARFIFRDYPIASLHPTAPLGHQAARCVAEQGAAFFWAMHDRLFSEQAQWGQLPDPKEYLAGAASAISVDMALYEACMSSGRTVAAVDQGVADAQALGYNGTPTFRFARTGSETAWTLEGAQPIAAFSQWFDALAAGGDPPAEPTPPPPELPYWATAEGLAPDPERPGFTMAGDPFKGNPDAVMAVVEFSDFQCPSCQRHALEVQPVVDKELVDSGEILWVFKNLPLQVHPQAPAAAAAAECAGEQGQFWPMYHLLFEKVDQWAVAEPDPVLTQLAGEVGLDQPVFAACLSSRTTLERVLNDLYDAQSVTGSTPTFVILFGGQARVTRGARPTEEFLQTLHDLLQAAGVEAVPGPTP